MVKQKYYRNLILILYGNIFKKQFINEIQY